MHQETEHYGILNPKTLNRFLGLQALRVVGLGALGFFSESGCCRIFGAFAFLASGCFRV